MPDKYRTLNVAPSSDGAFKTLTEAADYLKGSKTPTKLLIAPGTYHESVVFECANLIIEGTGSCPEETVIADGHYALEQHPDGFIRGTFWTAVVRTDGENITIRNLTIENTAGNGKKVGQAIALYTDGLGITVEDCVLKGYQDTLFTAPFPALNKHGKNEGFGPKNDLPRTPSVQHFKNCYIEGDVDFIFGGATVLFEDCRIFTHDAVKEIDPEDTTSCRGYISAPSTVSDLKYGYLFLNCSLESNAPKHTVFLGRPWRPYGKSVFVNCTGTEVFNTDLFNDWDDVKNRETAYFAVSSDMVPESSADAFYHVLDRETATAYVNDFKRYISHYF